jgi:hypothetical protein
MLTLDDYNRIQKENIFITIMPDGQVFRSMIICNDPELSIIPGSFNPLHTGHRRLYHKANFGKPCYFEISIARVEKEPYSFEEISRILSQFAWYAPVIITNAATFADKARLLVTNNIPHKTWWHVGFDTAARIIRDYKPDELAAARLFFRVYQRNDSKYEDLPNLDLYRNYFYPGWESGVQNQYDELTRAISSTKIRNKHEASCR